VQIRLEPTGGAQNPSGGVSFIDQTAFMLGADRITIDRTRSDPLWINGAPVVLQPGQFVPLAGGTIYNINQYEYIAVAKTGEQVIVDNEDTSVYLDGHTQDVTGLLGNADGNPANDLQLPDGTTLSQPLSFAQLYDTFASDWRVTTLNSLLDYGPGENTNTYTNLNFPPAPVSLSDLPQNLVQQAELAVTQLGITNPVDEQNAVLDYILAGSQAAQNDAQNTQGDNSTNSVQTTPQPPTPYLGVTGEADIITIASAGDHATFTVFLTTPVTSAVAIDYNVVDSSADDVTAAQFGGKLPTGTIDIAAGSTVATLMLTLPGSLALPYEVVDLHIASTAKGVALANADGYVTLQSGLPVAGIQAIPGLSEQSYSNNNFSGNGTNDLLDLGVIGANGINLISLELSNNVSSLGDSLVGSFASLSGDGFTLSPLGTSFTLAPGYGQGLNLTVGTTLGVHDEFFTLSPSSTNTTGYDHALPAVTLEVRDTIVSPIAQPGTLPQEFALIGRIGQDFGANITLANHAPVGGDKLGYTLSDAGGHVLPVQGAPLAPGGYAALSLNNIDTSVGSFIDTLGIDYRDVPPQGTASSLGTAAVTLSGTMYQAATFGLGTTTLDFGTLHEGVSSPILTLDVSNLAPPGTFSDTLIADYGQQSVTLSPGATSALDFTLNTASGGTAAQTAQIRFFSRDPAQPDLHLNAENITLEGTVIADAVPEFATGGGNFEQVSGTQSILNLGNFTLGGPTHNYAVGIANAATGPADALTGTLETVIDGSLSILGTVSDLEAGTNGAVVTLSFTPELKGDFSQTITLVATDDFTGVLTADTLTVEADVACYAEGTLIRTTTGARHVEHLQIGEYLPTLHGGNRRVKWIGMRRYGAPFLTRNHMALPVCFRRDSIETGVPSRDLWVSPGHALCLDGVLVHAWRLINGVSIYQPADTQSVTYYHVELESHEIIFAEDCPAESFMGEAFRNMFQNAASFHALYPEPAVEPAMCLPRLDSGFALEAIRQRLAARAGLSAPARLDGVRGYIDQIGPEIVSGWAQYQDAPEWPVALDILAGTRQIGRVLANLHRADVRAAGLGSGNHGFEFQLPPDVTGEISVRGSAGRVTLDHAAACARARA
jgi:hypothetical protein